MFKIDRKAFQAIKNIDFLKKAYNYSVFLFSFVALIGSVYDHSNLSRLIIILSAACNLSCGLKAIDRYSLNYFRTIFSGGSRPSDKAGGGGGHPDPKIRGVGGLQKHFSALRASVLAKKRGGGTPGPLPWIRH